MAPTKMKDPIEVHMTNEGDVITFRENNVESRKRKRKALTILAFMLFVFFIALLVILLLLAKENELKHPMQPRNCLEVQELLIVNGLGSIQCEIHKYISDRQLD